MTGPIYMTAPEYAVHRGCSDSYVHRLRREGRLVLSPDGKRVDVAASDAALDHTTHPTHGGDRSPASMAQSAQQGPQIAAGGPPGAVVVLADGPSVKEAVRRERLAKARLAELELGEQSGDLTRRKDVIELVFTLGRQALERLRTMSSRTRTRLAAESDPLKCAAIIDAEIAEICTEMQAAAGKLAGDQARQQQDQAA